MAFMEPQVTDKQLWIIVDGDNGTEAIPADLVNVRGLKNAMKKDPELSAYEYVRDYIESTRIFSIEFQMAYGVRLSASGYMDCTPWETYTNKREAERRARELARDED